MKATIKFMNNWLKVIYVTKEFNDEKHLNNYISLMSAKYNYSVDEVWY
jgi:hypothetical protein